jgi:hypothetical protein
MTGDESTTVVCRPGIHPRAEEVARAFHEAYELVAPLVGYEARRESAVAWEDVPDLNRGTMICTASLLLHKGVIR